MKATLRELFCTRGSRPLLPVSKCLSTSLSQNAHIQVDRRAGYGNPCRNRIKPSKRLILKSSDKGGGKGREAIGCCHRQGVGGAGSGQQPVQRRAAKLPRCLLLKEEGDCGEGAEPAASDVSPCWRERSLGVSTCCPLPKLDPQGGGGTRKQERPQDHHHLQSLLQDK